MWEGPGTYDLGSESSFSRRRAYKRTGVPLKSVYVAGGSRNIVRLRPIRGNDGNKSELGPGSYDPDVSVVRSNTKMLTVYQTPRKEQGNAVERIYKYIKEIKELNITRQPGNDSSVRSCKGPTSAQGVPLPAGFAASKPSCCFRSRTKKYTFPSDAETPGPGSYNMCGSFLEDQHERQGNTFGKEKRSIDILYQNNAILIKTQEEGGPGVGEYFRSKFALKKRASPGEVALPSIFETHRMIGTSFSSNIQRNCVHDPSKTEGPGPGDYDVSSKDRVPFLHKRIAASERSRSAAIRLELPAIQGRRKETHGDPRLRASGKKLRLILLCTCIFSRQIPSPRRHDGGDHTDHDASWFNGSRPQPRRRRSGDFRNSC